METNIVGIRFQKIGKVYYFDSSSCPDLQVGDFAVVETSRGRQLGEVIQLVPDASRPQEGSYKPIHHKATPRDLVMRQIWQKKEIEAMIHCRARVSEFGILGVKIVAAEFTFDGSRLSFLYSTEGEAKVDLRNLRNAMQRLYPRSHVEMRQIGPRDVAKIIGGMGACGLETRCCSMFLTDFSPISIKMAKEQGISLTPTEITGMCGRLRCCLVYEYEQYVEARKTLPKRNKRVITILGEGKVVDIYPLRQSVIVELENGERKEFPADELQPWDEFEALRRKSQEPCDRHENGECDCGKASTMSGEAGPITEKTKADDEMVQVSQPSKRRPSERRSRKSRRKKSS
ncbi:MAG TPA: regulatory iron-sulfur-containing complex subunit RicT [Anaerolineales bacterium]|nr:regulatory iron-sulfur-containing complex subunit RicT [Anaerolineales bacterium]